MRWIAISVVAAGIVCSAGCGNKGKVVATTGRQATVTLNDGSGFAGTVTQSSTDSITLKAPNGETRTYPMNQVASVQYLPGSAPDAPAAAAAPTGAPAPASAAAPVAAPAPATAAAPVPLATPAPAAAAATPAPEPRSAPVAPVPADRVVPAGAHIVVRNNDTIDSKTAAPGQTYSGVVSQPVSDTRGRVVIPRGSAATLVVRSVREQGKIEGQSELALDIDSVSIGGRRYRVETTDIVQKGRSGLGANKRTAVFTGGGTALGTLLGAIAGGGKGAAIGAISGAAAGTATQAVTRGHGVRVPAETLMTFRLEAPIRVREWR